MMNIATAIIERFGGAAALAHRLGMTGHARNTVRSWKLSGYIPAQWQQEVLAAGQDLSPPLDPYDFFFLPEPQSKQDAAE